jgi:hypothetical protein
MQEDIAWFQVSMYDAQSMQIFKAENNLDYEFPDFALCQVKPIFGVASEVTLGTVVHDHI